MNIDLKSIDMTNGVNEDGEPFVHIVVTSEAGDILLGQLSPTEVRQHALAYLEVAEAAEQDAATLRTIRKLGLQEELAAMIVTELRNSRK